MMIALAALKDWHISGLDIKTAFLYGDLNEELYMEQPEGFKVPGHKNKNKVMCLKKAIYGLKQCYDAYIFFLISHPFLIFMTHDDSSRTCCP
jgi:hypothetical protein